MLSLYNFIDFSNCLFPSGFTIHILQVFSISLVCDILHNVYCLGFVSIWPHCDHAYYLLTDIDPVKSLRLSVNIGVMVS
jgi:hypothetical protein